MDRVEKIPLEHKAPSKEIVWFQDSKHIPSMDEPEKFNKLLVTLVKPAYDSTVALNQEQEQALS